VGVKRTVLVTGAVGLIVSTGVIAFVGLGKIVAAFTQIGWRGLLVMCVGFLLVSGLLGLAWLVLLPRPSTRAWPAFFLARLVRDASGELLPFSSLGGFVFGARAAIIGGVDAATAISTTVVDVTAEFIGQIGFTALGVALLASRPEARQEDQNLLSNAALGLFAAVLGAVVFVVFQRRASAMIERAVARWAPSALAQTSAVTASLHALYERPRPLTLSSLLHFAAWVGGGVGVWVGLWTAGVHAYTLRQIVGVESLIYAVRSIGFAAPMGLGVIETGYALVGPLFGVSPEFSLALSLIKRARDIAVGVPALILWQALEGRRMVATPTDGEAEAAPAPDEVCPEPHRMKR
jgi:putative membrane protein